MNQISTPSKPASAAEISDALRVLFDGGLPFQRGVNPDNAAMLYVEALRGFTVEGIRAGITKFIRGECDDVSPRFIPTPPELAKIVRTVIVPSRIPEDRRIAPFRYSNHGERDRMRLKMPMFNHAFSNGLMDQLAKANREGMGAMIVLATKWGIAIPPELLMIPDSEAEHQWHVARNRALAEIERNPPPYMRHPAREQKQRARAA